MNLTKKTFQNLLPATLAAVLSLPAAAAPSAANWAAPFEPRRIATFTEILADTCPSCSIAAIERRELGGQIAQYSLPLRVGTGAYDVIRLHRVVRETAPFVPARTERALFMAHGDIWGFDAAFLNAAESSSVTDDHALPIFLAEQGVDVWGIDFRWIHVPEDTADLSFMASWNLETDAGDLRHGMAVARLARGLGGDGFGRLTLLGWSRGGQIGYAALDAETQLPPVLRHVKAFIPVDIYLKTDQPDVKAAACLRLGQTQERQATGEVADANGVLITSLGQLAIAAPAEPSPIVSGLSNRQTALLAGAATFQLLPPGGSFAPFYHFAGGTFDVSGLPNGLAYQDEAGFFDFFTGAAPFEPLQLLADGDAAICESADTIDVPDVAFDDHLGEITVPVLYVGAGGGFGDLGVYTTTLLGSSDVTHHLVSLTPSARLFDLGHADIFQADAADTLFWQPILDWIESR